eukprot:jgi/Tetstr1/424016/TSEL_014627.t1
MTRRTGSTSSQTTALAVCALIVAVARSGQAARPLEEENSLQAGLASTCKCPRVFKPVCDRAGVKLANNRCLAECGLGLLKKYDEDGLEYDEAWCDSSHYITVQGPEGTPTAAPDAAPAPSPQRPAVGFQMGFQICDCPIGGPKVCDVWGNPVAGSSCEASRCLALSPGTYAELWCQKVDASPDMPAYQPGPRWTCSCPPGGEPVCGPSGKLAANSRCEAEECLDLPWGSFAEEWCGGMDNVTFPECGCPPGGEPVCGPSGDEVASSRCEAEECLDLPWGSFAEEWCGGMDNVTFPECGCPDGGEPVCGPSGDEVASSRCEAEECLDLPWGSFAEEWCNYEGDPQMSPCDCPDGGKPVCDVDGRMVAGNTCKAKNCLELPWGTYATEWCDGVDTVGFPSCDCPDGGAAVCDARGAVVAYNRCEAEECFDLLWGTYAEEWCKGDAAIPEFPTCGCLEDLYWPVCSANGTEVAPSRCQAVECLQLPGGTFSEEWCPGHACDCPPDDDEPVCDTDGLILARSRCEARECIGLSWGTYAEEWCSDSDKTAFPDCDCPARYRPVCDPYGVEVAHNACIASKCFGMLFGTFSREWCPESDGYSSTESSSHSSSSAWASSSSMETSSSETDSTGPTSYEPAGESDLTPPEDGEEDAMAPGPADAMLLQAEDAMAPGPADPLLLEAEDATAPGPAEVEEWEMEAINSAEEAEAPAPEMDAALTGAGEV